MKGWGTGDKAGAFYFCALGVGSDLFEKSYHSTEPNGKLTVHFHIRGAMRGHTGTRVEMMCLLPNILHSFSERSGPHLVLSAEDQV